METTTSNPDLVAYCGLYCGACKAYKSGRCPGCQKNEKAKWCKVRSCGMAAGYATCADCVEHTDPRGCDKYHNLISRIFGFVFRSNRAACIARIREVGREEFAREMTQKGRHSLPR
jgi:hypothetical protein